RRDEAGGHRGRAARPQVALQHEHLRPRLKRPETGGQPAGSGSDDDDLHLDIEAARRRGDRYAHRRSMTASASAQVMVVAMVERSATAVSCTSARNAAQPSDSTTEWKSRTCASRTVEATPPFVTMP